MIGKIITITLSLLIVWSPVDRNSKTGFWRLDRMYKSYIKMVDKEERKQERQEHREYRRLERSGF